MNTITRLLTPCFRLNRGRIKYGAGKALRFQANRGGFYSPKVLVEYCSRHASSSLA